MILHTIAGSAEDVSLFVLLFILILVGFALFAHIVMGHTIPAFDAPLASVIHCMDILVGNFDAEANIYSKNLDSWVILAWYYLFNISMVWILINLFISIIDLSYQKAKTRYDESTEKKLIGEGLTLSRVLFHVHSSAGLALTRNHRPADEAKHAFTWISDPLLFRHGRGVGGLVDKCVR